MLNNSEHPFITSISNFKNRKAIQKLAKHILELSKAISKVGRRFQSSGSRSKVDEADSIFRKAVQKDVEVITKFGSQFNNWGKDFINRKDSPHNKSAEIH